MTEPDPADPIESLNLAPGLRQILRGAGISTAGDLRAQADETLMSIPHVGKASLAKIRSALEGRSHRRRRRHLDAPKKLKFLDTPQNILAHLNKALSEGNPAAAFPVALLDVVREHNVAAVARSAGTWRETLYKSLGGRDRPSFKLLADTLNVIGYEFRVVKRKAPKS